MKHVKKLFAFALTLVMAFAIALPAFAEDSEPTTPTQTTPTSGTITVANAAKGETYKLYKIFDATVDGKGAISYTGDIPTALSDYFTKDDVGTIRKNTAKTDAEIAKAVADYVKELDEAQATPVDTKVGGGGAVTFSNLAFGYYGITTSQGAAVTVDSTNPDATVFDKNSTEIEANKTVDKESYSIGDTITYTATFDTANYMGEGEDAKQVTKYVISDTLPEFLSNVNVTSIKVKKGTEETPLTVQQFDGDKQITIPWADEDAGSDPKTFTSKYANGSQIEIIYTAKLTSVTNINAADTNTVTIKPYVWDGQEKPWDRVWSKDAVINTYAAALKKVDGKNSTLALKGAEFTVKGLQVEETASGVYTVVSYNAESDTPSATLKTDDNGMLYIIGLASDVDLEVTETKAPDGYNKLTEPVTLEPQKLSTAIYKESGTIKYDAKGNVIESTATASSTITVEKNLSDLDANSLKIENNQGTELPSTGGIGTTIFYIVGGAMVVGGGVFLLTKRRMSAE